MKDFLENLLNECGKLGLEYFEKNLKVTTKDSPVDYLTEADSAVEELIIEKILKEFPDHGLNCEETGEHGNENSEFQWVVDPIDGTRNFVQRLRPWAHMIVLLENDRPILSGIYAPALDEMYLAEKDQGAWFNGNQMQVNSVDTVDHAIGAIVHDMSGVENDRFLNALTQFHLQRGWHHNHGCMIMTGYVAKGIF